MVVVRYMPNSDPWGPPGTRVMTIFVFYVNPQTPNIENFDVHGGLWTPGGISFFFSSNFQSNGARIMSGDPFLSRVMIIFINVTILEINKYICIYISERASDNFQQVHIYKYGHDSGQK